MVRSWLHRQRPRLPAADRPGHPAGTPEPIRQFASLPVVLIDLVPAPDQRRAYATCCRPPRWGHCGAGAVRAFGQRLSPEGLAYQSLTWPFREAAPRDFSSLSEHQVLDRASLYQFTLTWTCCDTSRHHGSSPTWRRRNFGPRIDSGGLPRRQARQGDVPISMCTQVILSRGASP